MSQNKVETESKTRGGPPEPECSGVTAGSSEAAIEEPLKSKLSVVTKKQAAAASESTVRIEVKKVSSP